MLIQPSSHATESFKQTQFTQRNLLLFLLMDVTGSADTTETSSNPLKVESTSLKLSSGAYREEYREEHEVVATDRAFAASIFSTLHSRVFKNTLCACVHI